MCAVDTLVAPMKVSTFDMNALAQLPDPLEYCTSSEVSSAICVNGPVSSILVKNPMSCTNEVVRAQPDKVINPNQEFSFKVVTKLLSADFDQPKNTVSVGVLNGSESTLNNNTAEHIISKQGNSSIGDLIWMDTNKNGIQENGENGVRDLQVQLI